ncbi:MAG: NAD(P)H dehydrogenase (quinone) [Pseudohongiellaceae bacterium]|jgi:NAD(P)H dehydrogenase (quinone)
MNSSPYVLVLFYSRYGATQKMAQLIARGIEKNQNIEARLRTVPSVSSNTQATEPEVPDSGAVYCSEDDLRNCSGLVLGSPTRFGNMSGALKAFIDTTGALWASGSLIDKPFGVFTSTASMHGGQESTLLSMALPMIHHGMVYVGLPYSEAALNSTSSGGTPYGASHVAGSDSNNGITKEEEILCLALGKRVARLAVCLQTG